MAGHSKWLNTKHRKAAQDTRRGKIFTKIISEVVTAVRFGGSDLTKNPRLRVAINKALSNNMNRNTLSRAIARGIGSNSETINTKTIIYEGYGPGGVAVIVECLSDNRNRTTSKMRHIFSQNGGNLGITGSVSYLFKKKGVFSFEKVKKETSAEILTKINIKNVTAYNDGKVDICINWEEMSNVSSILERVNLKPDKTEVLMVPITEVNINLENSSKLLRLINTLKENSDVKKIFHNGKTCNLSL